MSISNTIDILLAACHLLTSVYQYPKENLGEKRREGGGEEGRREVKGEGEEGRRDGAKEEKMERVKCTHQHSRHPPQTSSS